MIIKSVEFVGAIANMKRPTFTPEELPQIAVAGRSNVGKSSLLNALFNRKKLVRTSQTPGKTRELNFYNVNSAFYLVDLPGLGFAKMSHEQKAQVSDTLELYFQQASSLRGVVYLMDSRHEGNELDHETVRWIRELGIPVLIVATKIDKLSHNDCAKALQSIKKKAQMDVLPLGVSSLKKKGIEELWQAIQEVLLM
jgi:GTP-binding protein